MSTASASVLRHLPAAWPGRDVLLSLMNLSLLRVSTSLHVLQLFGRRKNSVISQDMPSSWATLPVCVPMLLCNVTTN